jgi:hypothetical protein
MGARCTFVFKQSEDQAVALYSHYGEYSMYQDLAAALQHAMPRIEMADIPYATRMAISYLIQDNILDETGFGIFAINSPDNTSGFDHPILIDLTNNTIIDDTGSHPIDEFISYHSLVTTVTQ